MARKGAIKWSSHSVFATPKIRAVRRSIIKRSYRATYCCAFWYEIFVKDSRGVTNLRLQTSDFILVKDFIFIHPEWYIISGHRPYFIKDFLQRFLAFRLPQKIPFPKTVICYLLFVTQKIRFQKLSTVNCNAWCELALSKKTGTVLAKPIFPFQKL